MNEQLLKLEPTVQLVINQKCKDEAPSTLIAYLLMIVGGLIGIHHFYMAYKSRGSLRTTFIITGVVYLFTFALGGTMLILDLFLMVFYINLIKKENEEKIVNDYLVANGLKESDVKEDKSTKVDGKYDMNVWRKKG
jgi:hypothetical protein